MVDIRVEGGRVELAAIEAKLRTKRLGSGPPDRRSYDGQRWPG